MRIYGPNGTTLGTPASSTKRTSSSGFSLPEDVAKVRTPADLAGVPISVGFQSGSHYSTISS